MYLATWFNGLLIGRFNEVLKCCPNTQWTAAYEK